MRIAIGKSRMALKWKNEDWSWDKLLERCSKTIRTKETMAEYKKMTRAQRDDIKDVGGFVVGAWPTRRISIRQRRLASGLSFLSPGK